MAAHVKIFVASLLAVPCLSLAPQALAADAGERTPDAAQTGTTNDKGMQSYGNKEAAGGTVVVDTKPAAGETAPAPAPAPAPVVHAPKAPAPAWAKEKPLASAPPGARLVILDGRPAYLDWNGTVIGPAAPEATGAAAVAASPAQEAKRKEIRDAEAKIKLENNIRGAIRRLGMSGWREAANELISYGKPAIPFLIEAMSNVDDQDNALPSAYQSGGHVKADTGRATRQRTMGDVCSELLTEMIKTHSTYTGELPTTSQEEWQAWWAANGETLSIGN